MIALNPAVSLPTCSETALTCEREVTNGNGTT